MRAKYNDSSRACRRKCPSRKDRSPLCKRANGFQRGILCRKNALERRDEAPKVSIPRTPQAELFEPARPKTEQMRLPESSLISGIVCHLPNTVRRSSRKSRDTAIRSSLHLRRARILCLLQVPIKSLKRQIQSRRPFSIFSMRRGRKRGDGCH